MFNVLSLLNNIFLILNRKRKRLQTNVAKNYRCTIIALNFADVQIGIHLIVIAINDLGYGYSFIGYEKSWRPNFFCHYISYSVIFSNIFSMIISIYMAFSRFFITKCLHRAALQKSNRHIWLLFTISIYLTVLTSISHVYIEGNLAQPLRFCVLLGNPRNSLALQIASMCISALQILSTISLLVLYFGMFWEIYMPQNIARKRNKQGNKQIFMKVLLIGVTNILCWLPSASLYIVSLISISFPPELLFLNLIVLTPINGVINPIIFNSNLLVEVQDHFRIKIERLFHHSVLSK